MEQQIERLEAECAAMREKFSLLDTLFCDVSQLLAGWHADGTSWSDWDETVRDSVSRIHNQVLGLLSSTTAGTDLLARLHAVEKERIAL